MDLNIKKKVLNIIILLLSKNAFISISKHFNINQKKIKILKISKWYLNIVIYSKSINIIRITEVMIDKYNYLLNLNIKVYKPQFY